MSDESLDLIVEIVDSPTVDPDFEISTTSSETSLDVFMAEGPQGPRGLTGPEGPQGPEGPTGPEGPAGSNVPAQGIVYTQSSPSTVWELVNPFDYRPDVVTYDNDGFEMFGDVSFPPGLIRVEFYYPMTGTLRSR